MGNSGSTADTKETDAAVPPPPPPKDDVTKELRDGVAAPPPKDDTIKQLREDLLVLARVRLDHTAKLDIRKTKLAEFEGDTKSSGLQFVGVARDLNDGLLSLLREHIQKAELHNTELDTFIVEMTALIDQTLPMSAMDLKTAASLLEIRITKSRYTEIHRELDEHMQFQRLSASFSANLKP
jgi:hypothetical protein